jgi:CRP/FNR family transcriptional regulator
LFCNLPAHTFSKLASIRQSALYPPGALLFVEDEPPRGLFVLCTGQAKLTACAERGKRVTMRVIERGGALGLSSVISNRPFQLTAETLLPSQICFFPRLEFLRFLRAHPEIAVRIAEHLSAELHQAWQHTRLLSLTSCCRAKLAQLLLLRAGQNGKATASGLHVPLNMTGEEIGEAIGATRETVSRLFSDLKRRHLIRVNGGSIILLKPHELRAIATT